MDNQSLMTTYEGGRSQVAQVNPWFGISHGISVAGENTVNSLFPNKKGLGKSIFDPTGRAIENLGEGDYLGAAMNQLLPGTGWIKDMFFNKNRSLSGLNKFTLGRSNPNAGFLTGDLGKDYFVSPMTNPEQKPDYGTNILGGLATVGSSLANLYGSKMQSNGQGGTGTTIENKVENPTPYEGFNMQRGSIFDKNYSSSNFTNIGSQPKFGGNASNLMGKNPYNSYNRTMGIGAGQQVNYPLYMNPYYSYNQ